MTLSILTFAVPISRPENLLDPYYYLEFEEPTKLNKLGGLTKIKKTTLGPIKKVHLKFDEAIEA